MTKENLHLPKNRHDAMRVWTIECGFCYNKEMSSDDELFVTFIAELNANGWKNIETETHEGVACPKCVEFAEQGEL